MAGGRLRSRSGLASPGPGRFSGNPEIIPGHKSALGKFDFLGYTSSNAVLDRETKR